MRRRVHVNAAIPAGERGRLRDGQVALAIVALLVIAMSLLVFVFPAYGRAREETRFLVTVRRTMPVAEAVSIRRMADAMATRRADGGAPRCSSGQSTWKCRHRLAGTDGAVGPSGRPTADGWRSLPASS